VGKGKNPALSSRGRKGETIMASLVRWRPAMELIPRRLWDWAEEDLFQDLLEKRGWEKGEWVPRVESYGKNGKFVIKADLPGVEAKNIQVRVEGDHVFIAGERKEDKEIKEKNVTGREIYYGSFQRSVPIPEGLKLDELKARYHDGVLEITAPTEKKAPSREIKIEAQKTA
jgi:HSP20 family protein